MTHDENVGLPEFTLLMVFIYGECKVIGVDFENDTRHTVSCITTTTNFNVTYI